MDARPPFGFVVEYVAHIETAKQFYVDILGLEPEREHPRFVQFQNFAIAADEPMGEGARQEVYWLVGDAEAAFRTLSANARISLPLTQAPFGKVFGVTSPDGHPRYLIELASNRPSRPVK